MAKILRAQWIVPVVSPPVLDGALLLDGAGRVRAMGALPLVRAADSNAEVEDFGASVLFPGLVNAHVHFELSHLSDLGRTAHGTGLVPWIRSFVKARGGAPPPSEETLDRAARELRAGGTAFVGDISNRLESVETLARHGFEGVVFHEIFHGADSRDAEALFEAAQERVESMRPPEGIRMALAPHAPYTVSPALFARIARWAREHDAPMSLHLAEDEAENLLYEKGEGAFREWFEGAGFWPWPPGFAPSGKSSAATLLADPAFRGTRLLAAHGTALSEDDAKLLAGMSATLCLCPRSNLRVTGRLPDATAFRRAGLRMCLGTDSLASNDDLSLLCEMSVLREKFPFFSANDILRMATVNGARALGIPEERVSFAEGSHPAVMCIPLGGKTRDPEAWLVARGHETEAERVG